jgi:hypothetical protein
MFIMIEGDLLNLANMTAVMPNEDGPGCFVQFTDGGIRVYAEHGPECFAQAIIAGGPVHYIKTGEGHEC